jgi:hypothetical protein
LRFPFIENGSIPVTRELSSHCVKGEWHGRRGTIYAQSRKDPYQMVWRDQARQIQGWLVTDVVLPARLTCRKAMKV